MLIAFHGFGNDYKQTDFYLKEKANENNFILISPNGKQSIDFLRGWNAGGCCGTARFLSNDLQFIKDLIKLYSVDKKNNTLPKEFI